MEESAQGARRGRAGVTARQSAKSQGGARRAGDKPVRVTLHLSEPTAKRLAVHSALSGRNQSKVADYVLATWLARNGRGREIFGPAALPDSGDPSSDEESTD